MTKLEKLKLLSELNSALNDFSATTDKKLIPKAAIRLTEILSKLGATTTANDIDEVASIDDEPIEDEYSDNPNDENYRYADTGYIAGSHKERASSRIKDLAKDGLTVKATDIEWDEIESDALIAEDVIVKANIIGEVDYQALKDQEMKPGTAFLIQKVLASIAPQPHWDRIEFIKTSVTGRDITRYGSNALVNAVAHFDAIPIAEQKALSRRAYVNGINTLKARLTEDKSIIDAHNLVNVLKDIKEEMRGLNVSANDESEYNEALTNVGDQREYIERRSKEFENEYKEVEARVAKDLDLRIGTSNPGVVEYRQGKFAISSMRGSYHTRLASMQAWVSDQYPSIQFSNRYARDIAPIITDEDMNRYIEFEKERSRLNLAGRLKAMSNTLSTFAWISLGPRFWNIVELQSDAFIKHANNSLKGKYNDWDLTIKPEVTPGNSEGETKKGKKKSTFELVVADNIERIGGDPVTVNSTEDLKDTFGFRDIQSGTWVLKDKTSAKFHVENAAAAMMDLSDIIGIDPQSLAFGGRLALAIGARGSKGAKAHYEPVQRVINITKMKGGGSLGHEWFHAMDNILGEVLGADGATGAGKFLSIDPDLIIEKSGKLSVAFLNLQKAMLEGDIKSPETFSITKKLIDHATYNINENSRGLPGSIFKTKDAIEALGIIDQRLGSLFSSKMKKNHKEWRRAAVAFHNQDKAEQDVTIATGKPTSQYLANSKLIDAERSRPYWSTTHEMAARAFQAFVEDNLKDQDRKNDYLSYGADNTLYANHNAYPEGDERKRINKAFKDLFHVIKEDKIFENAAKDEAMMDAIFGTKSYLFDDEQSALHDLFADHD